MISTRPIARCAIALPAAMLLLGPAAQAAQAAPGTMAAQSRGTIRISVSVMPRVRVEAAEGRLSSSSNAAGVRYTLVAAPAESGGKDGNSAAPRGPRLILVVHD